MNFLVLKGQSRNGVLRKFSDELNLSFLSLGHNSELLDLGYTNDIERDLLKIRDFEGDLIIAFGSITAETQLLNGSYLIESAKTPFLGWLVDDPIYHLPRFIANPQNRLTFACSEHHVNFLKKYNIGGKKSTLLAAGSDNNNLIKNFKDRKFDVTFVGSWFGEVGSTINGIDDPIKQKWLSKVISNSVKNGLESFHLETEVLAKKYGIEFNLNNENIKNLVATHYEMRKITRLMVVESLVKSSHLKIHIVGKDWKDKFKFSKNTTFSDDIDSKEIESVMADSKIVININAANGACERAFQAMSVGACVVSDMSSTLANYFKPGKEIFLFGYGNINSLTKNLEELIYSNRVESIADKGYRETIKNHFWINRANRIVSEVIAL